MKVILQLMNTEIGTRTKPIAGDRDQIATDMVGVFDTQEKREGLAVLILMDDATGDMVFSEAPLMNLDNFIEYFSIETQIQE